MELPFTFSPQLAAPASGYMSLTIVGSGVSTAVPVIGHLQRGCACDDAIAHPDGPNSRNNVSLLITLPAADIETAGPPSSPSEEASPTTKTNHANFAVPTHNTINGKPVRCILIDCGKTFRDAYFRVLVKRQVQVVDALLLTHDHADAVAGIDDLRDLQRMQMHDGEWTVEHYIPTYLQARTLSALKHSVGYIIKNSQEVGPAAATAEATVEQLRAHEEKLTAAHGEADWRNIGIRRSTALQLFTLPEDVPAPVHVPALGDDFPLYSLPVEHGKNYISLGFVFGRGTAFRSSGSGGATREQLEGKSCVVYISDVSDIPPASMKFLDDLVKIDVLYVDLLHSAGLRSPVHYCWDDVIALLVKLKPTYVFGIGMYCDIKHKDGQAKLREALENLVKEGQLKEGEVRGVDLGYDGLDIALPQ